MTRIAGWACTICGCVHDTRKEAAICEARPAPSLLVAAGEQVGPWRVYEVRRVLQSNGKTPPSHGNRYELYRLTDNKGDPYEWKTLGDKKMAELVEQEGGGK
jgi:hypothetical protein